MGRTIDFDDDDRAPVREDGEPALVVDVGGYEGPLDLLLDLARRQKVDLREISILALAEQYIAFVEEARRMRLELAADYLVMAAWLAYLKSRLLLPEPPKGEEPSAEELASALAERLRRLELIRAAAKALDARTRLGRDVHARGAPEPMAVRTRPLYEASLYDLLKAYAAQRQKQAASRVTLRRRVVWSLVEAREALERLVGHAVDWMVLDDYLVRFVSTPSERATVRASALSATLELAREGRLALRQERAFGPIWLKAASAPRADPVPEPAA
ncbi:segregation and condensation protein A [Salinarimonas ramus]|uniref:segregation and condensation protein A n=1 Tax=Salinarimonas ramus TaxID=690164 RepID=UPI00166BFE17|nr:ScpA family protein [Salinarimonas ramus]